MAIASDIIEIAFFEDENPELDRVQKIRNLARGAHDYSTDVKDKVVAEVSPVYVAMLEGRDPKDLANLAFKACQQASEEVLSWHTWPNSIYDKNKRGIPAEIAIFGLLNWGIASDSDFPGRLVRFATSNENRSNPRNGGSNTLKKTGYDIVLETINRELKIKEHKIQVKGRIKNPNPDVGGAVDIINEYQDEIIVVSPQTILKDAKATSKDINSALVAENCDLLRPALNGLVHQLVTQKAPNGKQRIL